MAKRTRRKNKKVTVVYLKFIILGVFFVFTLFFIFNRTIYFLNHAEMFKVKEVVRDPSLQFIESRYLTRLKGQSIFSVNLKAVQSRLQSQYPEIDRLRIIRKFPNRIYILAQKREPFAYLTLQNKDILLDKEGVVLSVNASPDEKLPTIIGIETNKRTIPGEPLNIHEVKEALKIIAAIEENEYLTPYKVGSVDVGNLSKIDLCFSNALKIIIDRGKIVQKIDKLGILIFQEKLDSKDIDYIDLRFKEPVVRKK